MILDQVSKFFVRKMILGQSIPFLKNIFHITYVQNKGGFAGMFQGQVWIFIWLGIMMLGALIYFWDKLADTKLSKVLMVFILIGIVGNLIDRIFLGFVTDFIDFRFWPVFNFADSYVSVSALVMLGTEFFSKKKKT